MQLTNKLRQNLACGCRCTRCEARLQTRMTMILRPRAGKIGSARTQGIAAGVTRVMHASTGLLACTCVVALGSLSQKRDVSIRQGPPSSSEN